MGSTVREGWGASMREARLALPGDELIPGATQITRAVTIEAPAADVWPWIVQLGGDRGGFYSYDWLENHFGFIGGGPANLGIHSAERIVPEWQDLRVGDLVAADAQRRGGWYVVSVDPGRALLLRMADVEHERPARRDEPPFMEYTWAFVLEERRDGTTRLLVRERVALGASRVLRVAGPAIGRVSAVMTRKMLIGIKHRAERHRAGGPSARILEGSDR